MFALLDGDFGRPVQERELFRRPVPLAGYVDAFSRDHVHVRVSGAGTERCIEARICALTDRGSRVGTNVSYIDRTEQRGLQEGLVARRVEIDHVYQALQSVIEQFEVNLEELGTGGDELDGAHGELLRATARLDELDDALGSARVELEVLNNEFCRSDEALACRNAS